MRALGAKALAEAPSARRAAAVAAQTVAVAAALVVAAKLRIYLPWSPVPITLQTFAVLVAGATLPLGVAAGGTALFVAAAYAGLPVLAGTTVFGPTGGYILGFVAAAAFVASSQHAAAWALLPRFFVAELLMYSCGIAWLAAWSQQGLVWGLQAGLAPFLVGEAIKLAAAWAAVRAWEVRPVGR